MPAKATRTALFVAALGFGSLGVLPATSAAPAPLGTTPATCAGRPVTIESGKRTIHGTSGEDGDDRCFGDRGADHASDDQDRRDHDSDDSDD